jgi:hypothetical protein
VREPAERVEEAIRIGERRPLVRARAGLAALRARVGREQDGRVVALGLEGRREIESMERRACVLDLEVTRERREVEEQTAVHVVRGVVGL